MMTAARGILIFLSDGLEHIIADDGCTQCKENVEQAQYLRDYIRRALAADDELAIVMTRKPL